ncbi:MAG: hypothetical protein JNK65_03360 [Deltaproteobacteria bacterium]|nr:hypothetical protein [Deltaproteobacteria bacterium]
MSNSILAKTLSDNARESVKKFSWSCVTDQVLELYQQVLGRKEGKKLAS